MIPKNDILVKISIGWFDRILNKFKYYIVLWEERWEEEEGLHRVTHIGIAKLKSNPDDRITKL